MAVTRPSRALPLMLLVLPITSPVMDFGAVRPVAAVLIKDPTDARPLRWELLSQVYGLTAAEARLAVALTEGLTVADYAEHNALSTATVRNQLRAVLARTETSRQVDLVRMLLSIKL